MIEALWSVEFVSNVQGFGAGVAVLETGRVLGGDSQYMYVGSYEIDNHQATVKINVKHYSGVANSIFGGAKEFNLVLEGTPAQDQFEFHGYVVENPELKIGIRLTRRAELP